MTAFRSTYVNKVDRKGRVSVPAPWRAHLAAQGAQAIVAYTSLTHPALEGFGPDTLDRMNAQLLERSLAGGDFAALLGGGADADGEFVETIMGLVRDLPFDGEGRIVLPRSFADHAGITEEAVFVGRGPRFQIWGPAFHEHQEQALARARARLVRGGGTGMA